MRLSPTLERWLLQGSDPSVQLRVLRELLDRSADDPAVLRARRAIGREGWVASILSEQLPTGQWVSPGRGPKDLYRPKYVSTNWRLIVLAELGAPAKDPRIDKALRVFLRAYGGPAGDLGGRGSELCFTGNAARLLTLFDRFDDPRTQACFRWLLKAQKSDGGWHCFRSRTGTLDGWEALAALSVVPADRRTPEMQEAVRRGAEFYLERNLLDEGKERYEPWYRLHYPNHYYYDLLVGLTTLVRLGYGSDRRLRKATDLILRKRRPDGTWSLEADHPDLTEAAGYRLETPHYPFVLEPVGTPSRWITTSALAALRGVGRL